MSFLARWFKRFRHPTGFIGRDFEGNRFFEHPSTSDDPRRTKRVVKYAKGTHMLDYVSGHRRLAVQWTSWLTHTRPHPPTLLELQADLERQRRILQNVAMIATRERAEAEQIAAQQAPTPRLRAPARGAPEPNSMERQGMTSPVYGVAQTAPLNNAAQSPEEQSRSHQQTDPSPWKPPSPDEPHNWQPRSSVRRGG
ncbi:hypothetical protein LXA43DRAFT_986089 [Ganoderma leucocontextum]|nr:hypothetical protein LXA43DRAFT_986089 [Ganoderma leucocontextum]